MMSSPETLYQLEEILRVTRENNWKQITVYSCLLNDLVKLARVAMKHCETIDIPNSSYAPNIEELEEACKTLGWRPQEVHWVPVKKKPSEQVDILGLMERIKKLETSIKKKQKK